MLPGAVPVVNPPAQDIKLGAGVRPILGSWRGGRSTVRSAGAGYLHNPPPVKSSCVACGRAAIWSSSGFLESENRGETALFAWGKRSLPREILENPLGATARLREILKFTRDQRLSPRDSDDDPWENRFSPTDSNRAPRDSSSVPWEMRVSPWEKAPDSKELARFPLPNELNPFRKIRFARFCGLIV
jgi:hypothetical protein